MLFKRSQNNKLTCNSIELKFLFNDILDETIRTPQELEYCVKAIAEALEEAAHDWFEDNDYDDQYDHCQIDLYFDEEVEKIKT